jgi:hypothetical protein
MWLDEEAIALNLRDRPLTALAGPLWLGQAAPFGWLAAGHALVLAAGNSERALRLLPVLSGIATVAAALWIGRRWMGWIGTAVLVLLCSIGQWLSYYRFEVKPYTGDAFWTLLLPTLAAWVLEGRDPHTRNRRLRIWWGAAAVGHWFAFGALFAVPALALLLAVVIWRRDGRRALVSFTVMAFIWLASFGLHYQLSLGATQHSQYLREYWVNEMPPVSLGLVGRARWVIERLGPLANNPGGTSLPLNLWLSALCGFAFCGKPALGVALAVVPLSAFMLGGLGVVPLVERLSLWIVPALYVGSALLTDRAIRVGIDLWHRPTRRRLALAVVAASVLTAEYQLCADIYRRGRAEIRIPSPGQNHSLDDRSAVRWLMPYRRPGDAVMTTPGGWPAVWWYGEIPPPDENGVGNRLSDGTTLYEMAYLPPGPDCQPKGLRDRLEGHHRVLMYLGFRDVPVGFDELLVRRLDEIGAITALATFAGKSLAMVVEVDAPASRSVIVPIRRTANGTIVSFQEAEVVRIQRLEGCVGIRPARRW